jgi:hypothetical protein
MFARGLEAPEIRDVKKKEKPTATAVWSPTTHQWGPGD